MRSVLVAVLLAVVPSHSGPPPPAPGPPPTLPAATATADIISQVQDPADRAADALGMDGVRVAGVVITPPAHPDARPWPQGIHMTPPEVGDRMLIAPGTNALSSELRMAASWGQRLLDDAVQRAGQLLGLVLPSAL